MKNAVLLILILVMAAAVGIARTPPLDALSGDEAALVEAGMDYFEQARVGLWSGRGGEDDIRRLLDNAERRFAGVSDPAARDYLLGRVALYRGRGELTWSGKGDARDLFERAMALAESSAASRRTSEALRLHADAGSSWMITKGLGGIIKMAPQVQGWSDEALELDPSNPLALIISAQGQINAPRSAGGDPEAAAARLEELVERRDLDDISLFWGRVSLAQAYSKLKDGEAATRMCDLAREIYPDSPMLEDWP